MNQTGENVNNIYDKQKEGVIQMIKGIEKRVIRVKCDPGCMIEEAFLIMKPGWEAGSRDSIIDEAEKLIFSFESGKQYKKKKRISPLLPSAVISLIVAVLAYFAFK